MSNPSTLAVYCLRQSGSLSKFGLIDATALDLFDWELLFYIPSLSLGKPCDEYE
jgi:hypothetical protein